MELVIGLVVVVFLYFIVMEGLNFVGAAKETAKIGAKGLAEVPNAVKWTKNEITIANKEYEAVKQTLPEEYKRTFKETYKHQRRESNARMKEVFEEQAKREKEADELIAKMNL